jgi:hypothetical protein
MALAQRTNELGLFDAVCNRCGRRMDIVAEIAPLRNEPGLRALLCAGCGAADSVLVYRSSRSEASAKKKPSQP